MKTNNYFSNSAVLLYLLFATSAMTNAMNDGPGEYARGTSNSKAGDYTINTSDELYHFQGEIYNVYQVNYQNSSMDVKIAVSNNKKENVFVAYGESYTIFYDCGKEGFGAKRVLFANPQAQLEFNPNILMKQFVLLKKHKVKDIEAIQLIAASLPSARQ